MYDHIAVAVDGSDCALRAAEQARGLAVLKPGIQVDLVYVVSVEQEMDALHAPEVFQEVQTGSIAYPAMTLFEKVEARVRAVRLYGRPADALVAYAAENQVDLIVMGTRGMRGLQKLRLGSVSERVLKLAACPVMVVK